MLLIETRQFVAYYCFVYRSMSVKKLIGASAEYLDSTLQLGFNQSNLASLAPWRFPIHWMTLIGRRTSSGPALNCEGNYSFTLTLLNRVASRMVGGVSVRGWDREHRVA